MAVVRVTSFNQLKEKAEVYLPAEKIAVVEEAYQFAAEAHQGQMRLSGDPYLEHPVQTAMILAEGTKRAGTGLDGETLVAGLEDLQDFRTGGISPPLTYGPDRRKATDSGKFYRADLDKEHFIPMTDWMSPEH